MNSINKAPLTKGTKTTAAALAAMLIGCGVCCAPLLTPLVFALLGSLGIYSTNELWVNGWWLAGAVAVLVVGPPLVWLGIKHLRRPAAPACATDCSCQAVGGSR